MTFKTIFAAAALVASFGVSSLPVHAQDLDVRHEKVRFDDLDLTSSAGAHVMLQRIHSASSRVCGPEESARELALVAERRQCMTKSLKDAVADVGNPIVTALFEGRSTPRSYELAMTSATPRVR